MCVFVCVRVLMHDPVAALGMSSCPRRAPACTLLGSGEMALPGRPGVQSRVGGHPSGLSAAHSFPCLAMSGCSEGWGGAGGERLTSQPSHLPFCDCVCACVCVCVNACALWTVTVQGSLPFGSCDRQHTEMVRGTHSGARLPGLRPSSAFPS